jgi:hypothetical protein
MTRQPIASAPRLSRWLSSPIDSGSWCATWMRFSTRAKYGSMSAGRTPSMPASRHHRSRMRSGVRHDMPPLITVEPPTARPSWNKTGGSPIAIDAPPSR